jgi:hypothetical protein
MHSEPAEITGDVDLDVADLGHGDGGQGEESEQNQRLLHDEPPWAGKR